MSHEMKTPLDIIHQEATELTEIMKDTESEASVNAIKVAALFANNFV